MKLIDYVQNAELTEATEIYNAKCNSPEEMMSLLAQINEKGYEFRRIIYRFNAILHNIKYCTELIGYRENEYRKRNEFKESRIGNLIKEYIDNNTEELRNEIRREIEISGNPFGVEFREGADSIRARGVKGELMYGLPASDYFHVEYTETFYTVNNYDIDEDIDAAKNAVKSLKKDMQEWVDEKEIMYNVHQSDFEALTLLFEKFQEKDPFEYSKIIYLDDYDNDDYYE